jgi:hypothetical protein
LYSQPVLNEFFRASVIPFHDRNRVAQINIPSTRDCSALEQNPEHQFCSVLAGIDGQLAGEELSRRGSAGTAPLRSVTCGKRATAASGQTSVRGEMQKTEISVQTIRVPRMAVWPLSCVVIRSFNITGNHPCAQWTQSYYRASSGRQLACHRSGGRLECHFETSF